MYIVDEESKQIEEIVVIPPIDDKINNHNNYPPSTLAFAEDTKGWGAPSVYQFYVSTREGGWVENSDNANGGLGADWAFHKSADKIKNVASRKLGEAVTERYARQAEEVWRLRPPLPFSR